MTTPVSGGAERAWANIVASAKSLDTTVRNGMPMLEKSGCYASYARQVYEFACSTSLVFQKEMEVPGLKEYAQLVTGNPNYDVVGSVKETVEALKATITWMEKAWPTDDTGRCVQFWFVDGFASDIHFPPQNFVDFIPLLQKLLETLG